MARADAAGRLAAADQAGVAGHQAAVDKGDAADRPKDLLSLALDRSTWIAWAVALGSVALSSRSPIAQACS